MEAIRKSGVPAKFYQASSSELFGKGPSPQNEETPFVPQSPYAAAKLYSYWVARMYREAYGMFASNGILFNHESPRRGETFVTRKITRALARIVQKSQQHLYLGNLDSKRDWGYTPDFVEVMWLMLQQDEPGDYVVGTGESHSVREFLDEAFGYVGMKWEDHVRIDPRYNRPLEVDHLRADSSKAEKELGWAPRVCFHDLVRIMVDADMELLGLPCKGEGRKIVEERFGGWHQWDDQIKSMEARQ
jgi:GDPmannose 4,6-dehydratase